MRFIGFLADTLFPTSYGFADGARACVCSEIHMQIRSTGGRKMRKSSLKMTEICGKEVVGKKAVTLARPTTFVLAAIYTVVSAAKIQKNTEIAVFGYM